MNFIKSTTKYKEGTAKWIKWVFQNNPQLTPAERIGALNNKVGYYKALTALVSDKSIDLSK